MRRRLAATLLVVAVAFAILAPGTAGASRFGPSGFPQGFYNSFPFDDRGFGQLPAPFVQDATNPHKWVWTLDPQIYGATGTVTFYDYANAVAAWEAAGHDVANLSADPNVASMQGPAGTSVNEWRVCQTGLPGNVKSNGVFVCAEQTSPFDFDRASFTQDVDVVPQDFITPDPAHDIYSDWDPTLYHPDSLPIPHPVAFPDANVDGSANLFKFAFTVAEGTQFMNMQVDRAGNYYVARRDMQWDWIDTFRYGPGPTDFADTQFNIQPYPISDAYGWCGALPPRDPNSLTGMAGQLIKDIAFDVWADDTSPDMGIPPFTTEIIPSFQMRSWGIYVVDATMLSFGVRQQFTAVAKGVNIRLLPLDLNDDGDTDDAGEKAVGTFVEAGDADFYDWFNKVSPFAAGVVPKGAWVINEGTKYVQVVPPGTPGAVWHQNKFAGAGYIVRGDMERRVNFINLPDTGAADQGTTSDYVERYWDAIQDGDMTRSDWTDWELGGQDALDGKLPDGVTTDPTEGVPH